MNDVLAAVAAPVAIDHRPRVEELLKEIFALMKYPATLDFKDMPDGALGVAVHFNGELPGITPGKRSYLVDCIQFLVNKAINRPNVQRRWVNLGINAFPEPRSQAMRAADDKAAESEASKPSVTEKSGSKASVAENGGNKASVAENGGNKASVAENGEGKASVAENGGNRASERGGRKAADVAAIATPSRRELRERDPRNAKPEQPSKPEHVDKRESRPRGGPDERSLNVAPDPKWTAVAQSLAKKAVQHGRVYALMMLSTDDRARVLAAAGSTPGLTVKTEGEGHWRRVTFTPEKITPILKKQVMPDYDDDEDE